MGCRSTGSSSNGKPPHSCILYGLLPTVIRSLPRTEIPPRSRPWANDGSMRNISSQSRHTVADSTSGCSGSEVPRNVVTAQRIDGPIARRALYCSVYYSTRHIRCAADRDVGNQASTKGKSSQAACHGSARYASR